MGTEKGRDAFRHTYLLVAKDSHLYRLRSGYLGQSGNTQRILF